MIRLLQSEIVAEPGRAPQQPGLDGEVGPGSAILRLTNTTDQENAYTIRLRCERPYWQDRWYTLRSVPPETEAGASAIPVGKPDQIGPHGHWLKVYVSRGGTRDVLLSFHLPRQSHSRAGRYPFTISVETYVSEEGGVAARGRTAANLASGRAAPGRFCDVPGLLIVEPFYDWALHVSPDEGRRVGLLKRRAAFEATVENAGNDWLYCDLTLPRPKDLLLTAPTARVAVPPPEPGEERVERSVPFQAVTKVRRVRGEAQEQALGLSAVRVHAPSVAPVDRGGRSSVGFGAGAGAVVAAHTAEAQSAPPDRATLTYRPLFASGVLGGVQSVGQTVRTVFFSAMGLFVAFNLWCLASEHFWNANVVAEPTSGSVGRDGTITVAGRHLKGARFYLFADGSPQSRQEVAPDWKKPTVPITQAAGRLIAGLKPSQTQAARLRVPPTLRDTYVRVQVQRAGSLPYLSGLLPSTTSRVRVAVGRPGASAGPEIIAIEDKDYRPGDPVRVEGKNFGSAPGTVYLGGTRVPAEQVSWSDGGVTFRVPAGESRTNRPLKVKLVTREEYASEFADGIRVAAAVAAGAPVRPSLPPPAPPIAGTSANNRTGNNTPPARPGAPAATTATRTAGGAAPGRTAGHPGNSTHRSALAGTRVASSATERGRITIPYRPTSPPAGLQTSPGRSTTPPRNPYVSPGRNTGRPTPSVQTSAALAPQPLPSLTPAAPAAPTNASGLGAYDLLLMDRPSEAARAAQSVIASSPLRGRALRACAMQQSASPDAVRRAEQETFDILSPRSQPDAATRAVALIADAQRRERSGAPPMNVAQCYVLAIDTSRRLVLARARYADYLHRIGNDKMAEKVLLAAQQGLDRQPDRRAVEYLALAQVASRLNDPKTARRMALKLIETAKKLPADGAQLALETLEDQVKAPRRNAQAPAGRGGAAFGGFGGA